MTIPHTNIRFSLLLALIGLAISVGSALAVEAAQEQRSASSTGALVIQRVVIPHFRLNNATYPMLLAARFSDQDLITDSTTPLTSITVAEAGIVVRLGRISQFNSVFRVIPAYATTGTLTVVRSGSMRSGALSPSLLWFWRKRKKNKG